MTFPRIAVAGGPRERGRQYGAAARDQVHRSIAAYRDVFAHYASWTWDRVRGEAARFRAPIGDLDARYLDEIAGIAQGAGVDELDVLAINVRTEVMFSATVRGAPKARPSECTAFAALPGRTRDGRTLLGQNWDWLLHARDTLVVLEARQDDGPDFVTIVEAGLLAKCGFNSSGVALATNALVCEADLGRPGMPYHVLLRAMLDSETISDAVALVLAGERASSANYLVAHEDGVAIDLETAAGDVSRVYLTHPDDGVIVHANHFANPGFDGRDVSLWAMPDSPFRLERLRRLVAGRSEPLDPAFFQAALADHATFPLGVCGHPDPRLPAAERSATAASVIMDVGARRMWLADGQPCARPFEALDYSDFLAKPSPLRPEE